MSEIVALEYLKELNHRWGVPFEVEDALSAYLQELRTKSELMSRQCPRCLKAVIKNSIHTCTPTDYARNLENQVEALTTFVCEYGGLMNEWALDWARPGACSAGAGTLRDYIAQRLKTWLTHRKELSCPKT